MGTTTTVLKFKRDEGYGSDQEFLKVVNRVAGGRDFLAMEVVEPDDLTDRFPRPESETFWKTGTPSRACMCVCAMMDSNSQWNYGTLKFTGIAFVTPRTSEQRTPAYWHELPMKCDPCGYPNGLWYREAQGPWREDRPGKVEAVSIDGQVFTK